MDRLTGAPAHSAGEPLFDIRRPADTASRPQLATLAAIVILAAVLRFWGLGNIGLHGDEDVMALATTGILETGAPVIPSGMYYPRALPQLYMMAGSVAVFGDSEWALRFPSAVVGTLMVLAGFWCARRFLSVRWAIAFAATLAVLPDLIADSQTARMYAFFVTFLLVFAACVFRWERSGSTSDWLWSVLAWLVALSFHTLSVFGILLFFYPGLVQGSRRLLAFGAVSFVVGLAAFKGLSDWSSAQYFPLVDSPGGAGKAAAALYHLVSPAAAAAAAAFVALAAGGGFFIARRGRLPGEDTLWLVAGSALLAAAVALAVLVQYHLAALAWLFGAVFYGRARGRLRVPVAAAVLLLGLFTWHALAAWRSPEVDSLFDLAEALLGRPKPLPYLTLLRTAPAAVLLYVPILLYFALRFARGRPFPDHALLFLITVFAPLFLMGGFAESYVPERYIAGLLPFFMLAFFAGAQQVVAGLSRRARPAAAPAQLAAAAISLVLFVNPATLAANVDPQYADFARLTGHRGVDHKGAAEYVVSRSAGKDDLVIVVDSQQQGYYLRDRVDYYMRSLHAGRNSSIMRDGRMLNLYTGVPQIASGDELARVVRDSGYDEILVVGSGEIEDSRMRYMANGIWSTMQALGFEQAWLGRDDATPVWRYTKHRPSETAANAPNEGAAP